MLIANRIVGPYSHSDAMFQTHPRDFKNSSPLQVRGVCIQSATYPIIGVVMEFQIEKGNITGLKYTQSAGGCLDYRNAPKDVTEVGLAMKVEQTVEAENPTNFEISVEGSVVSAYEVALTIRTNIPLPIEVMASVSIKGQNPTDTYIGVSKSVRLTLPKQTITLDGESENLPAGDYMAEVTFYPRWGAENGSAEAMVIEDVITGSLDIILMGSGESKSQADQRNIDQIWVMKNVGSGTLWDENQLVKQLGQFSKSEAALNFNDAYYFPRSDMTIIVNRLKASVTTWRMGRATR